MTLKDLRLIVWAPCLLAVLLVAAYPVVAQPQPTPPPIDELGQSWVDQVLLASQAEELALAHLKETPAYQQYSNLQQARIKLQQDRTTRIEARFPGFTVNWTTRTLAPKPAVGSK